ncbi:MAG: sortase [Chloroflexi bacterium]|nr:sortase [Chloroflexota bacterium]
MRIASFGLRRSSIAGIVLVTAGGALLVAVTAYASLGALARSQLDNLAVRAEPVLSEESVVVKEATTALPGEHVTLLDDVSRQAPPPPVEADVQRPVEDPSRLAVPRPGEGWDFAALVSQAKSGVAVGGGPGLGGFVPVSWKDLPRTMEEMPAARRIVIPAIGLDSTVMELNTKWEGDQLVWETAIKQVGHHRGSPNPGELGNTVFSGHISSPVRGEGAIFTRLPEVARLLRDGQKVEIVVHTGYARYLYRVVSTDVSLPDEVNVFRPADIPSLTLVTCVPDYFYSHRFLVTAVLVGVALPEGVS